MYKSATFLEVFKDFSFTIIDALYGELPTNTVVEKIIKLRLMNGLTQLEFARKIHRGFGTVTKWEQGLKNPSAESLGEIINIYGLSSNYFK